MGAAEDCREPALEPGSALGTAGFASRESFRDFMTGEAIGWGGGGSALDRMLEKAIGSAGLLGVCLAYTLDIASSP